MRKHTKISAREREQIGIWKEQGIGVREMARRLGRSHSSVIGELHRNRTPSGVYSGIVAQKLSEKRNKESRKKNACKGVEIFIPPRGRFPRDTSE